MADGNNNGVTTGTTPVEVVGVPAASTTRMIPRHGISIYNADTVSATVTLWLEDGTDHRVIEKAELNAGETFYNTGYVSLATTAQKLEVFLAGAVTTNELDFVAKYRDEAQ